jgi:hypothetical protein
LSELSQKYNVTLKIDDSKKFDVQSSISRADRIISIGFTTPGFDALCQGKQSIFFTPYKGVYNEIFNSRSPLVANTIEDLKTFLSQGIDYDDFDKQKESVLGVSKSDQPGARLCRYLTNDLKM